MAANQLDILRDRIYQQSDNRLRRKVNARLEQIQTAVDTIPTLAIPLELADVNRGAISARDAIRKLGEAYFMHRRDQEREAYVAEFLSAVEKHMRGNQ